MKINIKATAIELTPAISEYVNKKLSALDKYFPGNSDIVAQVEVGKVTQHHKSGEIFRAEIHIIGDGKDLYAATEEIDLYAAIDKVKDEIIQELKHKRGKDQALLRRGGQAIKNLMRGLSWKKR